jgi:hypothetical protein
VAYDETFQVLKNSLGQNYLSVKIAKTGQSLLLRTSVLTPRPCAKNSVTLPAVDYGRGDKQLQWTFDKEAWILYRMSLGTDRTTIIDGRGNINPPEVTFSDDR